MSQTGPGNQPTSSMEFSSWRERATTEMNVLWCWVGGYKEN
jgi:hypothetical protein